MLAALERLTLSATRALSVLGLIALMGLAAMTLADGLLRWLANRPIEGVRDLGGLAVLDLRREDGARARDHLRAADPDRAVLVRRRRDSLGGGAGAADRRR